MTERSGTLTLLRPREPHPALKRLDALVGKWSISGRDRTNPGVEGWGWESYEWLEGGFFLVVRWDFNSNREEGRHKNGGIMIVGFDEASQVCLGRYFDNEGSIRLFQVDLSDRVYTIVGDEYRYTGVLSHDGDTITGEWERLSDHAKWEYFSDQHYTRVR